MDKIIIEGKADLFGSIKVNGSKNAALPILVSSLLNEEDLELNNLPKLEDVNNMKKLLSNFGVLLKDNSNNLILNAKNISNKVAHYDIVRKMRASILILGPLLSRFKKARISLPGGCSIGTRPIDIHLEGLSKLGADFVIENGLVVANVKNDLIGNYISLKFPSVGATENILMASVFAKGKTIINNAAKEPEVVDLVKCLKSMGAKIVGEGTNNIQIEGVTKLNKSKYIIMSDRIVAGTYIIAAVMLNKAFEVKNIKYTFINSLIELLLKMGANLEIKKNSIIIKPSLKLKGAKIETSPYPGFPTDLQAQIMALMSIVKGDSVIKETIFENRFMHVSELNRLGADIKINKQTAFIKGSREFKGAQVMASDLRASVSLVLAAMCASGETTINRVYHLDRGYEKIEEKLGKCGPIIKRQNI
tara:strand:- start:354 stop:1610 length:1257 start_codon:yes stop_codon:yes gene_type:complete